MKIIWPKMSFKNLPHIQCMYSLHKSTKIERNFKMCEIPLDQIVVEWPATIALFLYFELFALYSSLTH